MPAASKISGSKFICRESCVRSWISSIALAIILEKSEVVEIWSLSTISEYLEFEVLDVSIKPSVKLSINSAPV